MRNLIDIAKGLDLSLNESSLSRVVAHVDQHACGIITAYRGNRKREVNQHLNHILVSTIRSAGFSATAVKGSYVENYGSDLAQEVSEHSFFVVNLRVVGDDGGDLERFLVAQGGRFDQDSIISIPFDGDARLIGTSPREDSYPRLGDMVPVGQVRPGKTAMFMSRVKNRPFVFERAEGFDVPLTVNGIRSMRLLAETDVAPLLIID